MSKISLPISTWLNTQDSQFTPTGKSVLIPLELEVIKDWTEATIDFSFTSPDRNLTASSIIISPIVLKNHKAEPITETEVNLTVSEDGFYDVEAKITVTLTDADSETGENKLLTTLSFGVFSFQGKYIYDFSSQAALDKYAEIEALSKPNKEVKTLINLAETNKITSSDNKLTLEQMGEISRHIFAEKQKIQALYNNQNPTLLKQSLPTTLSLKKDQQVTLKVQWSIDSKNTNFLPLDKAAIEVKGSDGKLFKGVLNKGKFKFTVPKDNFTFTATVFAKYSDKFTVYETIQIGTTLPKDIPITTNFSNQLDYNITDGTAPFWSVFSAVMDLTDIAEKRLKFKRKKNKEVAVNVKQNMSRCIISSGRIEVGNDDFYDWDVIAHEFGHAIANESGSIEFVMGGAHTGGNQYDVKSNGDTFKHKMNSIALAFNEGYGTWVGVRLLKESNYINKMPRVGDNYYTDLAQDGTKLDNLDLKNHKTKGKVYGEDTERGIAALLWQLSDQEKNKYSRALCSYKTDPISYSLEDIFNKVFLENGQGKKLKTISDFYKSIFKNYVGEEQNFLRSIKPKSKIDKAKLEKIHNLAMPFAEFGIGVNLIEAGIGNKIVDILKTSTNTLVWSQLKTGTLPGHDQFDIYFFNNELDTLVYEIQKLDFGKGIDQVFEILSHNVYMLQKKDILEFEKIFTDKDEHELYVLIAATATKKTVIKGKIATGPYFSNLAKFKYSRPRKTVIAVDSSGSNMSTDPKNLRIDVAHNLLEKQMEKNNNFLKSKTNELTTTRMIKTAAIDFDSKVTLLSDIEWPDKLYNNKIFNKIDSSGGTDIVQAIEYSIDLLKQHDSNGKPVSRPNVDKNSLFIFTDMDNNAGQKPVEEVLEKAAKENIKVQTGHLVPIQIRSSISKINDDISINTRQREAFDNVIEAILNTGGSYAVIEDAISQQAWMELIEYLDYNDLDSLKEIPLPLNICFYSIAKAEKNTPTYLITPQKSGEIAIIVDSKNSFVPNLMINGIKSQQKDLGQDCYEIRFRARAMKTYAVELNKPLSSKGLYSITARLTEEDNKLICEGELQKTGAALTQNEYVYVWGHRAKGQQGNGISNVKADSAPEKVTGLTKIKQLTGGTYHLLALDNEGKVWGWGDNNKDQIGLQGKYFSTPQEIITQVVQISSGEQFSMALDYTGQVWTWGGDHSNQLNNMRCADKDSLIAVNLNSEQARLIGCASAGAFAVTKQGHVWAWGNNETNGLGLPDSSNGKKKVIETPVHVKDLDKYADQIIYIGGGKGWGEALLDDGRVIGWGLKAALGLGISDINQVSVKPLVIMKNVEQLFVRHKGSFALTKNGKLYTWGQTLSNAPQMIYGEKPTLRQGVNSKIIRIGGGMEHLFYQTEQGDIYGVGYNGEYKLNQNEAEGANIDWPGIKISLS